jgi:hypothetical protein
MKRLLEIAGVILLSILLSRHSFAQVSSLTKGNPNKRSYITVAAKRTPVYSSQRTDTVSVLELEYPKVARNFEMTFPAAISPLWIRESGFLYVSFINEGNKTSAVFTPGGDMNYAIANLDVSNMPSGMVQKIKMSYPSCSIFNIKQIMTDNISVYEVILQDIRQFIVLSISHDEIEEVKKVTKG